MATDMGEIVMLPISTAELERRWAETRKAMAAQGIDCLVVQNSNQFLGGYVRWFIDVPTEQGYPWTVIFPLNEEMTTISSGAPGPATQLPPEAARGIGRTMALPYFLTFHYTNTLDAEATVQDLRARRAKRVGVVGKGLMSAAFYEYLVANLEGVEIVDATDMVDRIKAIKSPEEQDVIRRTAYLQDTAWSTILRSIRPGKKEYQIRSELQHLLVDMGSEEQWLMLGSFPLGGVGRNKLKFFQNRTLRADDQLSILIEVNGAGGFYTEIARTVCLGPIPDELGKAWEVAVAAQHRVAKMMVPGALPGEIRKAHNEYMISQGHPPDVRLFAHGQGYDLVERPAILEEDKMPLAVGMNIAVHPVGQSANARIMCCDNYLVTENGGELLHRTPQKIFEV